MLLTVDTGNTNTVLGVHNDGGTLVAHWRAASDHRRTADEWRVLVAQLLQLAELNFSSINGIVLASVVPNVTVAIRRMCKMLEIDPLVVDWSTDTGIPVLLDNPKEIGADRIANAVAAYASEQTATIVVDMGTATTLDVVSARGEYLGGVILPGIEISLDALFSRAAALKRVDLVAPQHVIGKSTVGAVQSGATFGYAAQVDGLCARVESEIGPCSILSTGGLSGLITPLSTKIQRHEPWLTLTGLYLIYSRNNSRAQTGMNE